MQVTLHSHLSYLVQVFSSNDWIAAIAHNVHCCIANCDNPIVFIAEHRIVIGGLAVFCCNCRVSMLHWLICSTDQQNTAATLHAGCHVEDHHSVNSLMGQISVRCELGVQLTLMSLKSTCIQAICVEGRSRSNQPCLLISTPQCIFWPVLQTTCKKIALELELRQHLLYQVLMI